MKKRIIIGSILVVIGIIVYVLPSNRYQEKEIITNEKIKMPDMSTGISMMYETTEGSGEYVASEATNWLGDGYVFNSELSSCENGGELTWDDTNKIVKMSSNKSDRCYVYFDIKEILSGVDYIKSLYTGTQGEYEWTISRLTDDTTRAYIVDYSGSVYKNTVNSEAGNAIRPVFFLESTVKFASGTGTLTDPYRIEI